MLAGALFFSINMIILGITYVGIVSHEIPFTQRANQGILLSARNSLVGAFWVALANILFGVVIGQPGLGILTSFVGIELGASMFGGITVIQHCVLRYILMRHKNVPLNYARFLDYAVERIFLRRIGGRYVFVHRLLMEHFASMEL
jgi:hypothetical protein